MYVSKFTYVVVVISHDCSLSRDGGCEGYVNLIRMLLLLVASVRVFESNTYFG